MLATGSWDGTVKLWNVYKNELIETYSHNSDVLAVAFRPDGKQVRHKEKRVHHDSPNNRHIRILPNSTPTCFEQPFSSPPLS